VADERIPELSDELAVARRTTDRRSWDRARRVAGRFRRAHSAAQVATAEFERAREWIEGQEERRLLSQARAGRDVVWTQDDATDPLVTVRIATYNRGRILADRAIQSILGQTYRNLEVLVVGDACDQATSEAVESIGDERLRFVNLPTRGLYPEDAMARWMVAGTHPMNAALALARGSWIAPCDDDDKFSPTHIEQLLEHAIHNRLEMVWSRAALRRLDGGWSVTLGPPLQYGHISHGSVLYSLGLRFFRHSNTSWKLPEPGDWNLWRRMERAGVRIGFLDELTYFHY
jgi:hypothetical protein